MSLFRVALLQMIAEKTPELGLEKGFDFCRRAKQRGADLALFPEMWNTGYAFSGGAQVGAVGRDGPYVAAFKALAKELDMAIAITYLERFSPLPRNTVTVIDRFGRASLTYAKVHTCDFGDEKNLTAGDDFCVADLDTAAGVVKTGAMICYDREFPESARVLMLQGAEIILAPNACPMEQNRLARLRARSFENRLGIATANYAEGQPDCNGHSSAFDGMAYGDDRPNGTLLRETCLVEADGKEDIYPADFPFEKLRAYRESEVHGNAYRHPAKYHRLIVQERSAPFMRDDARE